MSLVFGETWPPAPDLAGAACRAPGVNPLWFFPERGESLDIARRICAGCPEREPCAAWAIAAPADLAGVWAGTSPRDRAKARRRKGVTEQQRPILEAAPATNDHDTMAAIELAPIPSTNGTGPQRPNPAVPGRLCVECAEPLPPERLRNRSAVTCSAGCSEARVKHRQKQRTLARGKERRSSDEESPGKVPSAREESPRKVPSAREESPRKVPSAREESPSLIDLVGALARSGVVVSLELGGVALTCRA